tara:strand:- start:12874 stop:13119 length:246 start_codon:yes stop_codon:yes gene_type:complete
VAKADQRQTDYEIVFGSNEGKRVLHDIIANSFVLDTTFDENTTSLAFNEGMRNGALRILTMLHYKPNDFLTIPEGVEENEY